MSGIESCVRLVRVNYKEKRPVSVEEIYMSSKHIKNQELGSVQFLEDFLESTEESMVEQKDFIPSLVPVQYAKYLGLDLTTPIIKVETTYLSVKGKPYIYTITYNNPEEVLIRITN